MDIESKMEAELTRIIDKLKTLDPSTDEYKIVLNELSQLMGRDIEYKELALNIRKADAETHEKAIAREQETKLKKVQLRDDFIDKILRTVAQLITFGVSTAVVVGLIKAILTYEETGTVASPIGRKILDILLRCIKM